PLTVRSCSTRSSCSLSSPLVIACFRWAHYTTFTLALGGALRYNKRHRCDTPQRHNGQLLAQCRDAQERAMGESFSFGAWVRRRRKALDLTQDALARRVGCALSMIRKIEADERKPSRQVAALLASALEIPTAEREQFLHAARAELAVDK